MKNIIIQTYNNFIENNPAANEIIAFIILILFVCLCLLIHIIISFFQNKKYIIDNNEKVDKDKYEEENNYNYNTSFTRTQIINNGKIISDTYNYKKGHIIINIVPTYRKKEFLMTNSEFDFYKVLFKVANQFECLIFSQVVLYEILKPNANENTYRYNNLFNKIRSKSIDFVITNIDGKILFCIELDDKTHYRKNRIDRDRFLDSIFKEADLKLFHIKRNKIYNESDLKSMFINIKDNIS